MLNRKLNKIKKNVKKIAAKSVKVGVPASAAPYQDGMSTAVVAAVHEYGSLVRNVPPRPFIRPGGEKTIAILPKVIRQYSKELASGKMQADQFWGIVGTLGVGNIRGIWDDNNWAPLKHNPENRQPLLDTGHLKGSITYQVI